MLHALLWFPLAAAGAAPARPVRTQSRIQNAVVRIFTVQRRPDFYQPWQMGAEENVSGSGCILPGQRILTNAHVVSDQVFVQVRKAGDPGRYTARVEFVGDDTELAILRVDDPAFWSGTAALDLGPLPEQGDEVSVYGFPEGGEELSVTEGVVSRIEVTPYTHSDRELLTLQTDAAINPGNSGGPMVRNGKLVGVSFQMDVEAENVGYAVPAPVIDRFLKDVADGHYDGIPDLGIHWQVLANRALRGWAGVQPGESGVRVSTVAYGSSSYGLLRPGDVITAVDGLRVADDGSVPLRGSERVLFSHLVFQHQKGDDARLRILRQGAPMEVSIPMHAARELVPGPEYGSKPRYLIYAGLVFTPLSADYLDTWDWNDVPTSFKAYFEFGLPTPERRELVVLAHVLPHAVNAGYHELQSVVIDAVDGKKVRSLSDLAALLDHPTGRFQVIETDPWTDFGGRIVLDAAQAAKASPEILSAYGIPSDRRL